MVNHRPKLQAPWYADRTDGAVLHRYMNDDFIENYLKESSQGLLKANRHQPWLEQDKFGTDRTRLRLPIHRTFYVISTELVCDLPWTPAFSPQKIISAGFVVRKKVGSSIKIWRMRDGVSLGWQDPDPLDLTQDPDQAKRHKINPLLKIKIFNQAEFRSTGYTGEQFYPLHANVVKTQSPEANHTLLYGYLPLSGSASGVEVPIVNTGLDIKFDSKNSKSSNGRNQVSAAGYLAELEWPYGSWDGVSTDRSTCNCTGNMQEIIEKLCSHFTWSTSLQLQIFGNKPKRAFARWLGMLIHRYQIFDLSINENRGLREILLNIPIFKRILKDAELELLNTDPVKFQQHAKENSLISGNILDYVIHNFEAISNWFSAEENDHATKTSVPEFWNSLPNFTGSMFLTKDMAEAIRGTMLSRAEALNQLVEAELPLPRYTQGKDDTYFVIPFVRYRDECNCEKIIWGDQSFNFKVASPLDPQATRPSVIQLPELSDIKKGFANGVTFLTPKSLAESMLKIAPNMDMKTKDFKSPIDACLGFSISFSIPIITICAMILLMVVLNLLNIIFRWIPYAIMILPRLCFK